MPARYSSTLAMLARGVGAVADAGSASCSASRRRPVQNRRPSSPVRGASGWSGRSAAVTIPPSGEVVVEGGRAVESESRHRQADVLQGPGGQGLQEPAGLVAHVSDPACPERQIGPGDWGGQGPWICPARCANGSGPDVSGTSITRTGSAQRIDQRPQDGWTAAECSIARPLVRRLARARTWSGSGWCGTVSRRGAI